ncbi:MAG: ABC transporter ATP-binding protein [Cyanobacteria bacterium REEB67]|nr:ABC transporter ATP-binding protein [Cyanobacteria bacterium REEB67]
MHSTDETCALEAQSVSKKYEGAAVNALTDISLKVQPGEFYSFLGPSGCGKTTMLRIFAGFEQASSGNIFVGGMAMNGVPPNKRPVNMVFQSYALFPHLSVLENVAFGLRARGGRSKSEIFKLSDEALAIVRLQAFADRLPAQLSGGQQQRVALARALVMRPVVLLLDEPLSALDVQIREEMQDELSRLQKQLAITFVMVTHDQGEALALSTRVAVFNQGRIEQVGPPREIYEAPLTDFVARFIGRSNVLAASVQDVASGVATVRLSDVEGAPLMRCLLSPDQPLPVKGQAVGLCLKPEVVSPAVRGHSLASGNFDGNIGQTHRNTLVCRLESSAYLGSLADLRLQIAGSEVILRATVPQALLGEISSQGNFDVSIDAADLRLVEVSKN